MPPVTIHDAKTNLSRYVALIESGAEERIVIARGNEPAAMLAPFEALDTSKRLSVAKGKFSARADINEHNDEIAALFYGEM